MKPTRWLLACLVAALAVRVAFVFLWQREYDLPDQQSYIGIADNLLAGRGFISSPDVQVGRPPLYPLFLASCFSLFGDDLLSVRLLQAVLGSLVCLPVFYLGRALSSQRAGTVAAVMAALYPPFVFYTRLILTEAIFIALLPAAVLGLCSLRAGWSWGKAAATGAALGAAILLRPSSLLLWPTGALVVLIVSERRVRTLASLALASAVAGAVLAPWAMRNYRVTGHVVLTSLSDGWSLYEGNSPEATGGPAQHLVQWPVDELLLRDEYERNAYLRGRAIRYIREHPGRFLELTAVRFARMWTPLPNESQFRSPLIMAVSAGTYVPLMLLAPIGLWLTRRRWRSWTLLVWPVIYYALLHSVTVGSVRYRDPLMYVVIVAACAAVANLIAVRTDSRPPVETGSLPARG